MRVTVITVSDRASRGEYQDLSGPEITRLVQESYKEATLTNVIVSDSASEIHDALHAHAPQADIILTTGGTGISPRDNTPEVTAACCKKEIPGIAEALRQASYNETPMAMLSRGFAGMYTTESGHSCLIINFPGSLQAVRCCTKVVLPLFHHIIAMFQGQPHESSERDTQRQVFDKALG